MTVPPDEARVYEQAAIGAARAAGDVLGRRFRESARLDVRLKGLHDFVTDVDREAESVAVSFLLDRYPGHTVLAEEGSPGAAAGGHRWIVDPLDGTTNFIHGVPTFCVSIALEDDRGLVAGAIHDPVHGETFHATRGGGAWLGEEAIACRKPDGPHDALLATGFPFRELRRLDRYLETFAAFVRMTAGIRRAGSAALDLAFTACGRYDGFWEVGLSPWDMAAGALLVLEAGGVVTDVLGGTGYLETGTILAAGRDLHAEMLRVTRAAFGSDRRADEGGR